MAFTPCTNLLAQSLATSCTEPRIKGYEAIGIIINRADINWATVTSDAANPRIVTSLPLLATKKAAVIYNSRLKYQNTVSLWILYSIRIRLNF